MRTHNISDVTGSVNREMKQHTGGLIQLIEIIMFLDGLYEKKLKMVWAVEKNKKTSHLVGTAHFFPYSFKASLKQYIKGAEHVLFEGPLDKQNMNKVVQAGFHEENAPHLFEELDPHTIDRITHALIPFRQNRLSFLFLNAHRLSANTPYAMVSGMKSWLAFFTLWTGFLEKNGWKYSVDMEAYKVACSMAKKVIFLETIEEQIDVLARISHKKIIDFLNRVDHWGEYAQEYAVCYLDGDLKRLKSSRIGFPSRDSSIIDRRDTILYERMTAYLEKGNTVAFVGAPHIPGIRDMLHADGFQTTIC